MNADLWLELGFFALRSADFVAARMAWDRFIKLAPAHVELPQVRHAMDALGKLVDALEAHDDG
jgi:outer membrane protein assembly factor BamD (BamD/ComL family)